MFELWPIFISSMIMAIFSHLTTRIKIVINNNNTIEVRKIIIFLLAIMVSVFVGLRTNYNDTMTYRYAYEYHTPSSFDFLGFDYSLGSNPGFELLNIILKSFGLSTQSFILIYAIITNLIYIWFINKYSSNIFISLFLFFSLGIFTFTMAAIKQCVAVAICIMATDRFLNNKKRSFVFWVVIASTFHPYSLMYLFLPILNYVPWTKKTMLYFIFFLVLGIGLKQLLGVIVSITALMGEEYNIESFNGQGVHILRIAVMWAPILLSFFIRKRLIDSNNKINNILVNLSMLNAEIMLIGLFGTANYFARLANYFLIFQVVTIPIFVDGFTKKSRIIIYVVLFTFYFLFFIYSNQYLYGGFDKLFNKITFYEYLSNLSYGR